jgi:hypothetical protein
MTKWFQIKKLPTIKFYNFSRSTTFVLVIFLVIFFIRDRLKNSNFMTLFLLFGTNLEGTAGSRAVPTNTAICRAVGAAENTSSPYIYRDRSFWKVFIGAAQSKTTPKKETLLQIFLCAVKKWKMLHQLMLCRVHIRATNHALGCVMARLFFLLCSSVTELRRNDFPPSFLFGAGTSAYQVRAVR